MQPIKELLNKIKWDKRENPEDFSIGYLDRVQNKIIEIGYNEIKKIEGNFLVLEREGEEVYIPTHRIREVKRKGKIIWKR